MTRAMSDARGAQASPDLTEKIAFLRDPATYPDAASGVRAIETHLSWVFLTSRHAYKLKKPLRRPECDLSNVEARAAHCRLEFALNTRLSDGVYLDVVALGRDAERRLRLGGGTPIVDWLIRMRRLPEERMLDRLIVSRGLHESDLLPLVARLARFYRGSFPEPIEGAAFRARLRERIALNAQALRDEPRLARDAIERVVADQQALLEDDASLFDARVGAGRVLEGHGDLRPEHVCLESPPQLIDCLEFSRPLRVLDVAEELGFLALECERLGAPQVKNVLFSAYRELSGDHPPARLVDFYQGMHALVRARLALARVSEPARGEARDWVARAADYVRLAHEHALAARG